MGEQSRKSMDWKDEDIFYKENLNEGFENKYDVYKNLIEVDSNGVKSEIGRDFVLSRLDAQDKEFVIEMVGNAYYVRKLMDHIVRRTKSQTDKMHVKNIGSRIFNKLMNKTYMLTILNRNVPSNHLIKIIGEAREQDDVEQEEKTKLLQRMKKIIEEDK